MSIFDFIAADTAPTDAAVNRLARKVTALDGRGAVHIDNIVRDCLARRLPPEVTALRLVCAADLAEVLDRRAS